MKYTLLHTEHLNLRPCLEHSYTCSIYQKRSHSNFNIDKWRCRSTSKRSFNSMNDSVSDIWLTTFFQNIKRIKSNLFVSMAIHVQNTPM